MISYSVLRRSSQFDYGGAADAHTGQINVDARPAGIFVLILPGRYAPSSEEGKCPRNA
jgi:hypothetical protein